MRWWCVWFAATGCAYVSQNQLELKYDLIDADGDGSPGREDCDDDNPLRSPDLPEIIADGIDNDCDGSDNVDADGDQYPRVTRTVYAEMLLANGLVDSVDDVDWPVNVFESPADCEDAVAMPKVAGPETCTEQDVAEERCIAASAINPGRFDQPYDGVDADCDRGNDFDADGDGQMPIGTDPAVVTTYAESIGIQIDVVGANAFGDCNDEDASIYGGAPTDEPYDGHDRNCNGDNDFDQDGDGFIPASFAGAFDTFIENYHPDPASQPAWVATNQLGDCLDQPHASVPMAPEAVYPGAPDEPYDGVDADCAGDSDFDADRDGFTVTEMDAAIEAYRELWSVGDLPSFVPTLQPLDVEPGDCDDTLPLVAPGNLESLGDDSDADCDGQNDTTPFAFGDISWQDPGWPRIVRNDNHFLIASQGSLVVRYNATGSTTLYNPAPYVTFSTDPAQLPGYKADPFDLALWANDNPTSTQPLSLGFDVISEGDLLVVPHSFNTISNGIYKMAYVQRTYQALGGSYSYTELAVATNTFLGYDADLDASRVPIDNTDSWGMAVACGGSGRSTPSGAAGDPTTPGSESVVRLMGIRLPFQTGALVNPLDPGTLGDSSLLLGDNTGDVCWMHAYRESADRVVAEVHVCDTDGCKEFEGEILEDPSPVGNFVEVGASSYSGRGIIEADVHENLLITVEDAGLVVENYDDGLSATLFAGEPVLSGDAMIHDGNLYAIAVIAEAPLNLVRVAYGPWDDVGSLTVVDVPVEDPDPDYVGGVDCVPATSDPNCTAGRVLDPHKVAIHADADRVVLAVSALTPDGYVASAPSAPISGSTIPAPQDAVGWAFLETLPPSL